MFLFNITEPEIFSKKNKNIIGIDFKYFYLKKQNKYFCKLEQKNNYARYSLLILITCSTLLIFMIKYKNELDILLKNYFFTNEQTVQYDLFDDEIKHKKAEKKTKLKKLSQNLREFLNTMKE